MVAQENEPTDQQDTPPTYEAVVSEQRGESSEPVGGKPAPYASITVVDPVKQGDGVNAYISYKVVTNTHEGGETAENVREWTVIRRFRDFFWLRQSLQKQYAGVILPPLPARNVVEKFKMAPEFIEDRRRALERFLVKVAEHETLNQAASLRLFLTASESEFMIESARMSYALGAAAPAESGGASGLAASASRNDLWTAYQSAHHCPKDVTGQATNGRQCYQQDQRF